MSTKSSDDVGHLNTEGEPPSPIGAKADPKPAEVTEATRWYESELLMKQIGAISSLVGVGSVVVAVVAYLTDLWTPVRLKISAPAVVELRCSLVSFKPSDCNDATKIADSHVSVSGAFRIEAVGPARSSASIDSATATLEVGKTKIKLSAFWSMGLVPGSESSRRQVVPISLSGGQAQSQEIWFMPIPVPCSEGATTCEERKNFQSWRQFQHTDVALTAEEAEKLPRRTGKVTFCFRWSESGKAATSECQECTFQLGPTVFHALKNRPDPLFVTVTAQCKEKKVGTAIDAGA